MPHNFEFAAMADKNHGLGFAGKTLDPQAEKRDETSLPSALANPDAQFLLFARGKILLKQGISEHRALFSHVEVRHLQIGTDEYGKNNLILLGEAAGTAYLALDTGLDPEALPPALEASEYRALYTHNLLSPADSGMVAQAAALLAWHRTHRFCGRCGHETEMRIGGFKRVCTSCTAEHFPRTDPVVIMLVTHQSPSGERCLLARSPHFAPLTYSCLAGFVEPGETIENAVRREVREESGLPVGQVTYHASQPWPFPYSLMIGCFAQSLSGELNLDHDELEDGGWFTREEARAMLDNIHQLGLRTPPAGAIASALIRHWVENS
ncbi:NAD(+) diphosphatase [Bacillus subtilis]|nr:NAD(+) diphosphatase [Pseudochrobactrum asaccharolyticum]MCF7670292.1 NAD(+) diphosphatase [Bacillus subtilis]